MERNGILVIGSANMDMVVKTSHFPCPGETAFGERFGMFPGGKGANQAVACAKLGMKTYFLGKIGRGVFGDMLVESMKKSGVDLQPLLVDPGVSTGIAVIMVDENGQNRIVVVSGGNMSLLPSEVELKKSFFTCVNTVLCQLEIPTETVVRAAAMAKEEGNLFILNPAPARDLPDELFTMTDFMTPNETELERLTGIPVRDNQSVVQGAREIVKRGTSVVVVTMGDRGACLVTRDSETFFPPFPVRAQDTTAAGDAFTGAFVWALGTGKTVDQAVRLANAAASISVTRLGAQDSMPSLEELKHKYPEFAGS